MLSNERDIQRRPRILKGTRVGLVVALVVIAALAGLLASIVVVSSLVWLVVGAAIIATVVTVFRWRQRQRSGS